MLFMSRFPSPIDRANHSLPLLFGFAFAIWYVGLSNVLADSPPSLTLLRQQTRELLRQQAVLPPGDAKDDATVALCDLYVVLRYDSRYDSSEMLKGDATKIRRRLLTVARLRERELRREGVERPAGISAQVESAIESALAGDQQDSQPGAAAAGGLLDNGWQLVELIQRIVSPDFWESRGGPGSIRYFAMKRVLVVRATSDVHQQIKDLLTALR